MTITYAVTQRVNAHYAEFLASHHATKPRFILRAGDQYLHWSGLQLTEKRSEAWSGTFEQAKACKRKLSAAAGCKAHRIVAAPQIIASQHAGENV